MPGPDLPATELAGPLPVRRLMCGDAPVEEITAEMTPHLPSGGMAARRVHEELRLTRPTWRLLDARILAGAVRLLDLDVTAALVTWLSRHEPVCAAAERTLTDPEQPEAVVTLLPPQPLAVSQGLGVTVCIDDQEVATITFRLDVSMTVDETSVVVERGELCEVVCDTLTVSAALLLTGWSTPLWRPAPVSLPDLRLAVRPPVVVPLLPVPRFAPPTPPAETTAGGAAAF
jgi:hypothetical protein